MTHQCIQLSVELVSNDHGSNRDEVAAAAFLATYSGRTLDAYRQDLRGCFAWAGSMGVDVLAATRPHVELYRHHLELRGIAPSTIDRRLSTVCGFYRFAHIDGRIAPSPAQYVRRGLAKHLSVNVAAAASRGPQRLNRETCGVANLQVTSSSDEGG